MLRDRDRSKDREIAIICFYEELPVRAIGEVIYIWNNNHETFCNWPLQDCAKIFRFSRQVCIHWHPRESYGYDEILERSRSWLSERTFRASKVCSVLWTTKEQRAALSNLRIPWNPRTIWPRSWKQEFFSGPAKREHCWWGGQGTWANEIIQRFFRHIP